MSHEDSFFLLLERARQGEETAAAELVRLYEPHVRRVIRMRLTDSALRRQADTMDICQSVMGNFFVRLALGEFDLQEPAQLVQLLASMAKNRLLNLVRHERADKRDIRRLQPGVEELPVAAHGATPSEIVSARELLDRVRGLLSPEEMQLVEARADGKGWPELAVERGESAEALRKRLKRAVDRVAGQIGLEELDGD